MMPAQENISANRACMDKVHPSMKSQTYSAAGKLNWDNQKNF